jgi:hypothetical protein
VLAEGITSLCCYIKGKGDIPSLSTALKSGRRVGSEPPSRGPGLGGGADFVGGKSCRWAGRPVAVGGGLIPYRSGGALGDSLPAGPWALYRSEEPRCSKGRGGGGLFS